MSRKNKEKRRRQAAGTPKKINDKHKEETAWDVIKDLFTNPFEYRSKNPYLGKILGGLCLFAALCLLFYITGHNM